jgi:O-antigen/teichoic acid export membrane protein
MPDNLTHRVVKKSVYSLIGFVWPLLLSFVAAPIIIRTLGSSKFGFYALLNTMLVVFGLLDFGIDYTFTKELSENRARPGGHELSLTFSSTTILYAFIGIIALLCLMLFQGAFRSLFKIPDGFISSFSLAFFIIGASFLMKMLAVSLSQIPYALQRQDIPTNISLVSNTLLEVGSIIALKTGHGVLSLLVIQLIASAFTLLSFYFTWHYLAPDLKFIPALSKKVLKTIGRQGFWVFLSNTMGNILAQLDKFVLGAMWGPAAVGYYSTAQLVPGKIYDTSFSLSSIFFPIFSEASALEKESEGRVKAIFRRILGFIPIIAAGLTVVVLLYGYQLVRYWVSPDFADNTAIAVPLLAVTYFLLSFGSLYRSFLNGLKALKFLAFSSMVVAMTDVVFMFLLIPKYSFNGASWAYLFSSLPMVWFLYYIERKYFRSGRREIAAFYGKVFGKILLVSAAVFLLGWFAVRPFVTNLLLTLACGGATFILYLLLFWMFGFYNLQDRQIIKTYAARTGTYFGFARPAHGERQKPL